MAASAVAISLAVQARAAPPAPTRDDRAPSDDAPAASPPREVPPEHDEAPREARYRTILAAFEANEGAEWRWWTGWTATYAVAAVGYGAFAAATTNDGLRADAAVGAAKATLALGSMFVLASRTPLLAAERLRSMDARTPAARAVRLAAAERMLDESAAHAADGTSWRAYALADAVNLAGAAVLLAGYRRPTSAWLGLAVGVLVSHAAILTRPRGSIAAAHALGEPAPPPGGGRSGGFSVGLTPTPEGLVLVGTF